MVGLGLGLGLSQPVVAAGGAPAAATWPSLIGAEMMVNGDCSSGTGWSLGTGATIAAGKMAIAAASSSGNRNDGVAFTSFLEGGTYRCAETADSVTAGGYQISLGTTMGTVRSAPGTYTQDLVAAGLDTEEGWLMTYNGATMQLDNFSVKSVGLLGISTDWTFTGDAGFDSGSVFFAENASDTASLAGAAKTSFDAAVSNSTACTVTLSTLSGSEANGTWTVAMKGGSAVNFVFNGSGSDVMHTVTSGTGSGFVLANSGGSASGYVNGVTITLA